MGRDYENRSNKLMLIGTIIICTAIIIIVCVRIALVNVVIEKNKKNSFVTSTTFNEVVHIPKTAEDLDESLSMLDKKHFGKLAADVEYKIDLNADGTEEIIRYECFRKEAKLYSLRIYVNDVLSLEKDFVTSTTESFFPGIIDLDCSDDIYDIYVSYDGYLDPGYSSQVYSYDGNGFTENVCFNCDIYNMEINKLQKPGLLSYYKAIDAFGGIVINIDAQYDADTRTYTDIEDGEYEMQYSGTLKKDLDVYFMKDMDSKKSTVKAQDDIEIDNIAFEKNIVEGKEDSKNYWLHIQSKDFSSGWFYVEEDENGNMKINGADANEYFDFATDSEEITE